MLCDMQCYHFCTSYVTCCSQLSNQQLSQLLSTTFDYFQLLVSDVILACHPTSFLIAHAGPALLVCLHSNILQAAMPQEHHLQTNHAHPRQLIEQHGLTIRLQQCLRVKFYFKAKKLVACQPDHPSCDQRAVVHVLLYCACICVCHHAWEYRILG